MRGVADLEDNIQFQIGGEHQQLSIQEFTRAMDIYSADVVESLDAFATLTREFDFPCFKSFYESKVKKSNSRSCDVKLSEASKVKPEWWLIHHVIDRSMVGKNRSKGNLTARDMNFFQSMHLHQSFQLILAILSIFKRYETDHPPIVLHGGFFVTRLTKFFQVNFGAVQFRLHSKTNLISFDVLKSRMKVLHMNDDGIWGVRGFSFPITNTLDVEDTVFCLSEATTVKERRGLVNKEEHVESMYEGGEAPPSTSHPVPPPINNARNYRVEAMIAAILHNQRREKEA
ncbi:unnamed protein product [Linum trigynum]|uniref:Uncharacterized protein n=1 Tax=Linum trigynum TaxID=586398 RepID=A0AAV2DBQ8_9ROSI